MKKRLELFLLLLLCLGGSIRAQVPSTGLVAYYPFIGTTLDSTGNGNDATAAGCAYFTDRFGNPESALYLDGLLDSLTIPVADFTPMDGDFSISMWFKSNDQSGTNLLALEEYPNDTVDNFQVKLFANTELQTILELNYATYVYWNGSGAAGNRIAEGFAGRTQDGNWKHMVLKRSNDTLQLWYNRVMYFEEYTWDIIGDTLPFIIGAGIDKFHGLVDDIAFYNRAITEKEIMKLYHDHQPYVFSSPKSTDAYIHLDTATIAWLADTTVVGDSIDLDYSTDGGTTWLATGQNQLVEYYPYKFGLPFGIGTDIDVRIQDHHDPGIAAQTGAFTMSEYAWENVTTTLPFPARDGVGLLVFDNKMWLLGGWDPPYDSITNYTINEVWNSTDGITWDSIGLAPWMERHCGGWLVHDSAMWVIGGDPQSGSLADVWRSTDGITWDSLVDRIPGVNPLRTMVMVNSVNGNILYSGGTPSVYIREGLNEVFTSPDGINWTQQANAPWEGRGSIFGQCVDENDTLYMLGGGGIWDRRAYNDVWKTGDGVNWELVNDNAPWKARYWHNVAWFDNKMWVMCGMEAQEEGNDAWYSSDGIEWHELKNAPLAVRHAASANVYNDAIYMMCGIATNDVWRLRNVSPPLGAIQRVKQVPVTGVTLYPNPTTGLVHSTEVFTDAAVYDLTGKLVGMAAKGMEIDMSHLPAGVYSVRMRLEGHRVGVHKLVKE